MAASAAGGRLICHLILGCVCAHSLVAASHKGEGWGTGPTTMLLMYTEFLIYF